MAGGGQHRRDRFFGRQHDGKLVGPIIAQEEIVQFVLGRSFEQARCRSLDLRWM